MLKGGGVQWGLRGEGEAPHEAGKGCISRTNQNGRCIDADLIADAVVVLPIDPGPIGAL